MPVTVRVTNVPIRLDAGALKLDGAQNQTFDRVGDVVRLVKQHLEARV